MGIEGVLLVGGRRRHTRQDLRVTALAEAVHVLPNGRLVGIIAHAAPYISTMLLNPPQNMRMPSKGMAFGSIMSFIRGSAMTLALTASRCSRES